MPDLQSAGPVTLQSLLGQLRTSEGGLSAQEARRRRSKLGPNEPAPRQRTAGIVQVLLFFANPLVIILLIASLVSALLGELVSASITVVIVLLSVALNYTQTFRSQRVAERLREQVAPSATALRGAYFLFLAGAAATYLLLVQLAKRRLMRRLSA